MKKSLLLSAAALSLASLSSNYSFAGEFAPRISGVIPFEIQNDWAYDSDDPDAEVNTLTTEIEPYFTLSFNERLALEAGFVFEPVQAPDAGDDTEFENEGLFVQEIKLTYSEDNFGLFAGKYNPTFGTAWDLAPGIYGTDFAEDYELTERIGFGGSCSFESPQTGRHTVTGNTFFLDTTVLSESTITKRGDTDKSDGGISNTENFSSFSVTLDSESIADIEGLNTHVGYYNQSEGDADVDLDNEIGYAIGANYTFPVSEKVKANVLGEWVAIRNSGGSSDDVNYLTASLGLTLYENWNVAASYTKRDTDVEDGTNIDDRLYQISAGYEFDNGFSVDVGYRGSQESDVDTHILGGLLAYTYEF
jgi:hypothetical protein